MTAVIGQPGVQQSLPTHSNPNQHQVGGTHYKALHPEPWDVIIAWDMHYLAGNVLKYVARYRQKDGIKDLEKAKHYLDKLIEYERQKPG